MSSKLCLTLLAAGCFYLPAGQDVEPSPAKKKPTAMAPELEPFRPLLGKTYTARFATKEGQPPTSDVQRWERMLNGKGVRLVHSINDGAYGGETIFTYDRAAKTIKYHYFTTAGFMTVGTLTFDGKSFTAHEKIKGTGTEVSEVKSETVIQPNGNLIVRTKMLRGAEWQDRDPVTYKETPKAKVRFR